MFKEVYKQIFQDMYSSLHQELKDIQDSDDWIGFKLLSSLVPILATLMGLMLCFIPIIIIYVLSALSAVVALPFYWIVVKSRKIRKIIILNALLEERRKREKDKKNANKQYPSSSTS